MSANIEQLAGISGHADKEMLVSWINGFTKKPKTVFVNHGDDTVCDEFAQTVTEKTGINAVAPYNAAEYDLISGVCLKVGNKQKIVKKGEVKFRESTAFSRLFNAAKRLLAVVEKYREAANKDIAKFADQITELSDKWDK